MDWRRKVRRRIKKDKIKIQGILERLRGLGLDSYTNEFTVRKILVTAQLPSLSNVKFLNFLREVGFNEDEIRKIILEVLSEQVGLRVKEQDIEDSLKEEKRTLKEFLKEKKEEKKFRPFAKTITELGWNESSFYNLLTKNPSRLSRSTIKKMLNVFGKDFLHVYIKNFVHPEYLKLFKNS